jgi:hypothetical protein
LALASAGDNMVVLWTQMSAIPRVREFADIYGAVIRPDTIAVATVLAGLWAEPAAEGVHVRWRVGDALRWSGFDVYRAEAGNAPGLLTRSPIEATGAQEYEYEDRTALLGESYRYWVELVALDGSRLRQGPVEVTVGPGIGDLQWAGLAPNPSSDTVELELGIARAEDVTIEVYDVAGSLVRRLVSGRVTPGPLRVSWDGMVVGGRRAPPGIYVVSALSGAVRTSRRMVRFR